MPKRPRRGASIQKTLQSAASPAFALSARRTVTFFNAGCEALTGWPAAEIVGETCDYAGDPNPANVASVTTVLCPPAEVLEGREAAVPAYVIRRDGGTSPRMIHFFPLLDSEGAVTGVLGLMLPLPKPNGPSEATPAQLLHAELAAQRALLRARFGLKTVVARCPPMLRVVQQLELARSGMSPVLLRGERGSGKEHLARVIHTESETRNRSFVPLDCRTLPEFELRQTLRRLFSQDPDDRRTEPSLPTSFQPGTLFLQHVEALPRDLQEFVAKELAGDAPRFAVRVLAGTTADLADSVAAESFREDLFYRLTALKIDVPPLRDRVDEIPLLAQSFLEEQNRGAARQKSGFSDEVLRQFCEYRWPGNLQELAVVVAEAWTAAAAALIQPADLPFRFRTGRDAQEAGPAVHPRTMPLEDYLAAVERDEIERVLEMVRHNRKRAADLLGMTRPKLYRRMEALGVDQGDPSADDESEGDAPATE